MAFSPNFCIQCGTALESKIYHDGHIHPVCPKCGWAYFPDPKVAAAVVVNKDNKVLLVRRLFDPQRGEWSLPAGFINAFEDPAQAAARECLEETGIEVKVGKLLTMVTGRDHPRGADIVLVYSAEWISGEVKANDDADEAEFFPMDQLPNLAFRATRIALGQE